MPRVQTRVKSKRGKPYTCSTCGKPIEPGEEFYYWSFRYGGTRRSHSAHGRPRESQLTQSRMGEVYGELEAVQDMVDGDPEGWTKDDVRDALQSVADLAQEIADEARNTADEHFGGGGPHAERADQMEEVVSTLEDAVSSVDDVEVSDDEEADEEHELVETTHDDGTVTQRCETCDVEMTYDPKEMEGNSFAAEAFREKVKTFLEEHAESDDDEQDDDGDPWFEQVRSIVSEVSI